MRGTAGFSRISKVLVKLTNREAYKHQKFLNRLAALTHPNLAAFSGPDCHFKHSGNIGDIIYALPAVFSLARQAQIHFHLRTGVPADYGKHPHPLGSVRLDEATASRLAALLLAQPRIVSCQLLRADRHIDFDLDLIRTYPFSLEHGNIARWYFHVFATNADLGKPWLDVDPDPSMAGCVVVARSQRHRAPGITYGFLRKYSEVVFVGVEAEWRDMRNEIPDLGYRPIKDFLELARVIKGSRLFIGNQSFPFSLAEALKVRRLLEVFYLSPNVNVEGIDGFDFCYQPQFESLVARMLKD